MRGLFSAVIVLLGLACVVATTVNGNLRASSHIFHSKAHLVGRPYIKPGKRAHAEALHTVVFAIQQRNLDTLEEALLAVSDPRSPDYGRHWTREQVGALTANPAGSAAVLAYLRDELGLRVDTDADTGGDAQSSSQVKVLRRSLYDEFLEVQAPVRVWERVFATKFFEFRHADWEQKTISRAMEYSLPAALHQHVVSVARVADFPVRVHGAPVHKPVSLSELTSSPTSFNPEEEGQDVEKNKDTVHPKIDNGRVFNGYVTPARIRQVYEIFNSTGNARTSQAVYSTIGQTVSTKDLLTFQKYFGTPQDPIAAAYHGYVNETACYHSIDDCMEANLDFQYMMSTGQSIPTISYYDDYDRWTDWLIEVSSWPQSQIPKVFSMSYGTLEMWLTAYTINAYNTESAKLSLMGVSLIVASGDDGAPGFGLVYNNFGCAYYPDFPSISPYWTVVGGTMGPESGTAEVTCSAAAGGGITSGGGFSGTQAVPSWQSKEVSGYLNLAVASNVTTPATGYKTGRGYPDVSLLAKSYLIVANGTFYGVGGTSASAPVFAGMIGLLNSARAEAGLPSMGWLNPFLYAYSSLFVNDITSGHNKCTRYSTLCCAQGFHALTGWDPVTGLGSVNYKKLYDAAVTAFFNSSSPSLAPTASVSPSLSPSRAPSRFPTQTPTQALTNATTKTPSTVPTRVPFAAASLTPTQTSTQTLTNTSTKTPSTFPTRVPFAAASLTPTQTSTQTLTNTPTKTPSKVPSTVPTAVPSASLTTKTPTRVPTRLLSQAPTVRPTVKATVKPTVRPTVKATVKPTVRPTVRPTVKATVKPTVRPTVKATVKPTVRPTVVPTRVPVALSTRSPTRLPSPLSTTVTAKTELSEGENEVPAVVDDNTTNGTQE